MTSRSLEFLPHRVQQAIAYFVFVARRLVEDKCLTVAGSLTFTTLLAIVPLFTVTVTLTAKLAFTRDLILQLKAFVLKNFVPDMASRMVGTYMDQFSQNASRLTIIGLAIVLTTAVALLFTIENTFNGIWRTRRERSWFHRLRWAVVLLIVGPFAIATSISVSMYFVRLTHVFESSMPWLDDGLMRAVPVVTTAALLYLAYRWIPNRFVPTRHALFGAVVAAVCFELMKNLFVLYVSKVPTYSLVYGAFASVPIFLIWLFLCWLLVLVGAEITATLSYIRHVGPGEEMFAGDVALVRIQDALLAAGSPRSLEELRHAAPMPIDLAEDAVQLLIDQGFVEQIAGRPVRYSVRTP